jgi:acetyltransferase-like isoleucine patch superfamily enzyme
MSEASSRAPDSGDADDEPKRGWLRAAWDLEFGNLRPWMALCTLLLKLLPEGRFNGVRTGIIRAMGLVVGRGTRFLGLPKIQSPSAGSAKSRLHVGAGCTIGRRVILEFGESLTIGERVVLQDGVVILTTTHQLGPREHRAGKVMKSPVFIGNDVEVGTNAIILPGVTIGDGARVLEGSVVNAAVAAGTTVNGIPARPVRPA